CRRVRADLEHAARSRAVGGGTVDGESGPPLIELARPQAGTIDRGQPLPALGDLLGEHDRVGSAVLDGLQAGAAEPERDVGRVGIAVRDVGAAGQEAVAEDLEVVAVGGHGPQGTQVYLTGGDRRVRGAEVGLNYFPERAVDVPAGIA